MTDKAPVVALLFDDSALGAQLRAALDIRGARIVHEGPVASLSRELLQQSGVDVLVVNLDDSAEKALDGLHELIDGDRPRVVFNDAQASRSLEGWDRARWARHLAVKVMAAGDIDPPRPQDARSVEAPAATTAYLSEITGKAGTLVDSGSAESEMSSGQQTFAVPDVATEPAADEALDDQSWMMDSIPSNQAAVTADSEQAMTAESESLAAELEALLASGELPEDDDTLGTGLRYTESDELPPLHDGDFSLPVDRHELHTTVAEEVGSAAPAFGNLQLEAQFDPSVMTIPGSADVAPPAKPLSAQVSAPASWALVDATADVEPAVSDASAFGIQKVSAAEFLAPEADPSAPGMEPVFNLELVSIEQAVAPQQYKRDHEMVLDELGSALSRLVLTGAAPAGLDSVREFLGALPGNSRLTVLHTQHLSVGQSESDVVEKLVASCPFPVRLAVQGGVAGPGEVLLVPAGQYVVMRRDGKIELQSLGTDENAPLASIDASFTMAANAFGRDAVAIVFAGRATDAVAGSQAVHDRGGQVWVESSSGEHFADMVSGIFAERLVSFSGTPSELAAHLIEVFP